MSQTFADLQAEAEQATQARDAVQERIAAALERIANALEQLHEKGEKAP